MTHSLTLRMALLLTLPPLLWAGNAVIGKLAVGIAPPVALNFVRWSLALCLLWPLGHAALRDWPALRARWRYLSLLGLLGMGSYNALQYLALHTSSPLNATLITASSPVWMLAIGALFYGVRPRGRELLGALLSLLGVMLVISRGSLTQLLTLHFVPGDLLMVLAILSWGFYSWLLARPPASMQGDQRPNWDWAGFLAVQISFGLVWCGLSAGVEAHLSPASWEWGWPVLLILLYVAVGPSLIAYRCWGLGVATVGPATASFFVNLTPVFAALFSALWLGEAPQWFHAGAFGLIVAGIWISSRR
ncbi:membrane protein [Vitreoscilla filiformis]|jgi:drug/metabolite transporter (DMT)-like permease|uniref:Membrane protein n=1 Tax=Vitreoscilla filiformis TaxID=63 RepID=A0A221KFW3_VITFI|nr:DMT family transporter [Vitreoscilla filiformis]ASM77693.1 membrane protein [Vitreoscilla filiformis]